MNTSFVFASNLDKWHCLSQKSRHLLEPVPIAGRLGASILDIHGSETKESKELYFSQGKMTFILSCPGHYQFQR